VHAAGARCKCAVQVQPRLWRLDLLQLGFECSDCLLEHLAVGGSGGARQIVRGSGAGELEGTSTIDSRALSVGERTPSCTVTRGLFLLCFDGFGFPAARHTSLKHARPSCGNPGRRV
jgi:hypothetical protein